MNKDNIIVRLSARFGKISQQEEPTMLSVKHIYYPNKPFIPEGFNFNPTLDTTHHSLILNETLVDHFFKEFGNELIYDPTKNINLEEKLVNFCTKYNLKLNIIIDPNQPVSGVINKNIITVYVPNTDNSNQRKLVYVILHELSHYITNTSSKNKLKQFIQRPLTHSVNINNVSHIHQELEYILNPSEMSNWAFTLSLYLFENDYKSSSELYSKIKKDVKYISQMNILFIKSKVYNSLPEDLKMMYNIQLYLQRLIDLKSDKHKHFKHKYISLIKTLDKYVKRLNKLFISVQL